MIMFTELLIVIRKFNLYFEKRNLGTVMNHSSELLLRYTKSPTLQTEL